MESDVEDDRSVADFPCLSQRYGPNHFYIINILIWGMGICTGFWLGLMIRVQSGTNWKPLALYHWR
ncbi:hypothetical protein SCA6_014918 [Theobroma cacao]